MESHTQCYFRRTFILCWMIAMVSLAVNMCVAQHIQGLDTSDPSLRIYNPTKWSDSVCVKVPTGRFAAPGLLDWSRL